MRCRGAGSCLDCWITPARAPKSVRQGVPVMGCRGPEGREGHPQHTEWGREHPLDGHTETHLRSPVPAPVSLLPVSPADGSTLTTSTTSLAPA